MTAPDDDLPLAEPGLQPRAAQPDATRRTPLAVRIGVGGLLLMIGAVLGMYVQGPFVRVFFAASGLEPGGGAIRDPIAVSAPEVDAEPTPVNGVVALGKLQPLGSVIEVAAPTTAAAPRVLDVLVSEGDIVAFDASLVILDTYPQLLAARDAAERAVAVAEASLAKSRRDVSVGRQESSAGVDAARAAAAQAERDRERQERLHVSGATTDAQLEAARAAAEQTAAELRRAEAAARRHAGNADIRLAERNVEAARSDLVRAEAELANATVTAPSSGTVLSVDVRPGERAPTGTLLTLADLSRMEAEIEVYQEAVPRLSIGQAVRLESPVLQEPLAGTIRRIGLEVGRQSLTSNDPAAATDARVVKAWVDVDPASTAQAARFVGLEVIAHIDMPETP